MDRERREEIRLRTARWRAENRAAAKEQTARAQAAWRARNPEKARRAAQQRRKRYDVVNACTRRRRARKVNAEGHHSAADIRRIYAQQQGRCLYCHALVGAKYHVDHKMPLSRGGSDWPDNLAIACERCNTSKGTKTAEEFRA